MSVLRNQKIGAEQGFYTYCSFVLVVTVVNIPSGSLISQAWCTLKNSASDADADAVLQKNVTTSLVAGVGQVSATGASNHTGELTFLFTPAQTSALTAGRSYAMDVKCQYDSGETLPIIQESVVVPGQAITRDYT